MLISGGEAHQQKKNKTKQIDLGVAGHPKWDKGTFADETHIEALSQNGYGFQGLSKTFKRLLNNFSGSLEASKSL